MLREELSTGDTVMVRAWWTYQKNNLVKCKITHLFEYNDVWVQPLEGNPHGRSVKYEAVIEKVLQVDWPAAPSEQGN